ncbi:hypothetical protein GCM10025770_39140 [Viridibacterium curvum]|uniref:Uncharacterized protein n=1 Tax=Viridibacterium curvum TaxID=1101404 RepID=A0ABP9R7G7_9RHOO
MRQQARRKEMGERKSVWQADDRRREYTGALCARPVVRLKPDLRGGLERRAA